MVEWIKQQLARRARSVVTFAQDASRVIRTVWNKIEDIAALARTGWRWYWRNIRNLDSAFGEFLGEIGSDLYDLYERYVPDFVKAWVRSAINIVKRFASRLVNGAINIINSVRRWASARISDIADALKGFRDWAFGKISTAWNWVTNAGVWLWNTVHNPGRLVAWILPAALEPITRFVIRRAERIGRWMLERMVGAALTGARIIERVIVRIM